MIAVAILALLTQTQEEPAVRTPSIYRCSRAEGESKFFAPFVEEEGFDTFCIEPKPGPTALEAAKGRVKFIPASLIDTKANLKWRNAIIDFVNGKISPKAWLAQTKDLKETVHFLSSPKTPNLRDVTGQVSRNAVFAEMLLLSWPGKPCLTADDIGGTRYLPGPGRLESWILAMNDYCGPMLYSRYADPYIVTGTPKILRADDKPGLLIFRQQSGKKWKTYFLNNGPTPLELPAFKPENASIALGLDIDSKKPRLNSRGFFIENSPD